MLYSSSYTNHCCFQAEARSQPPMDVQRTDTVDAVAVVVVEGAQMLVIRRSQHVCAPGKICFPGGHVEAGESESDAVRREMREELAVGCVPQGVVWRSRTRWGANVAWWLATLADRAGLEPNAAEVAEIMWLSTETMLAEPDLLESNQQFLEALERGEINLALSSCDTDD